jgi:hypothetical protein
METMTNPTEIELAPIEPQPKPSVRKYDKRSVTSAENGRRAWGLNLGAQVAELEERIRELADSTSDERLKFEALRYLRVCRAGKLFTATNPAESKGSRTDNRIQIAAATLIMGEDYAKRLSAEPTGDRTEPQLSSADERKAVRADEIAQRT